MWHIICLKHKKTSTTMKRLALLTMILSIFMISCHDNHRNVEPVYANFEVTPDDPAVGEYVYFFNTSRNATSYSWDFGDGTTSTEVEPAHWFAISGSYTVTLTAYNEYGHDSYSMNIDVYVPTLLVVEVAEWNDDLEAPILYVPDARVRLYPSITDWENQTRLLYEGYTDAYGVVVFAYIDTDYPYFVDVWDETHNNVQLKLDNEDFVTISGLLPNFINWFTAWVDVVSKTEVNGRTEVDYVIKKIERKPVEAGVTHPTDKDYMKLLEQSIKVK